MGKAAMRAPLIFITALFVTATVTPASAGDVLNRMVRIHHAQAKADGDALRELANKMQKHPKMQKPKKENAQLCKPGVC
jgi:hypothetical protein